MAFPSVRNYLVGCMFVSVSIVANVDAAETDDSNLETGTAPETQTVTAYLNLAVEQFSTLSGGLHTGTSGFGLLETGLQVDLNRLLGWSGMSFHVSGLWAGGEDISINAGAFNTISNIVARDGIYFYDAWLQKKFLDDQMRIKLGQMRVDDDFMGSDYGGLFINSGFGILNTFSGNIAIPTFPLAGLGALVQYRWPETAYVQLGVYDGNAGSDKRHGLDFHFSSKEGVAIVYEIGAERLLAGKLDGKYKFGGFYHTGREFTDFRDGTNVDDNYSFYVVVDQALINQSSEDHPKLGAFFRAGYSPQEERNTVSFYAEGGINLFAPFSGRDDDIAGLGLYYTDFSGDAVTDLRMTEPHVNDSESVLEILYQAQITPWLVIKPEMQFIFDPMLSADDAILFGTRVVIAF